MCTFVLVPIGIIIQSNSLRPYLSSIVCRYYTHSLAGVTLVTLRVLFNFLMKRSNSSDLPFSNSARFDL